MVYYNPIGGSSRWLFPNVAIHSCPFSRLGFAFGGRTTIVRLEDQALAVFGPIPFGPEAENLLKLVTTESGEVPLVKYLISQDVVHWLGIKSWKEKFPQAMIIAGEKVVPKLAEYDIKVDFPLKESVGNKILGKQELQDQVGIPKDFASAFDLVYLPNHSNKELIFFHHDSKSMIEADFFVTGPANEQYKDSGMNPVGGFSMLMKYFSMGSRFQKFLVNRITGSSSDEVISAMFKKWPIEHIIPSHGDVIESNGKEEFAKVFPHLAKD